MKNKEWAGVVTTSKDTYTLYRHRYNEHSTLPPFTIVTSRGITLNFASSVEEAQELIVLSEMDTRDLPGMKEKLELSLINYGGLECYRALWRSDTEKYLEYLRLPTNDEEVPRYVNRTFFGVSDAPSILLTMRWDHPIYAKISTSRMWDGWTPGCSNSILLLTEEEWNILLQAEKTYQEEQRQKAEAEKALQIDHTYDPIEIAAYRQQYGTSDQAWDAGNERAWALLREIEI